MVWDFEQQFLVFKQSYMYFHTLFHPYVFPKNINNVTRTMLPNWPFLNTIIYNL